QPHDSSSLPQTTLLRCDSSVPHPQDGPQPPPTGGSARKLTLIAGLFEQIEPTTPQPTQTDVKTRRTLGIFGQKKISEPGVRWWPPTVMWTFCLHKTSSLPTLCKSAWFGQARGRVRAWAP